MEMNTRYGPAQLKRDDDHGPVPVRCEVCGNYTMVIRPGDKAFCMTEECRFPCTRTSGGTEAARHHAIIYRRRLEEEVLELRAIVAGGL